MSFATKPHAEHWYAATAAIFANAHVSSRSVERLKPSSCEWNTKFSIIPEIPLKRVHSKRIPKFSKIYRSIQFRTGNFGKFGRMESVHCFVLQNSFFREIQRRNWRFLAKERAGSLFRIKSWLMPAAVCPLSFAVSSRIWLVAKQ